MILNDIVRSKKQELERKKLLVPYEQIKRLALKTRVKRRSLIKALQSRNTLHLICELKKASPSEGIIRKKFNPGQIARIYERGGASAISVLTETNYFKGNPETIKRIRPLTTIPLLRKDFIIEPYQVYESAVLQADAFLIIINLVTDSELKSLLKCGAEVGLDALVEIHTKDELRRALKANVKLIGINNRNLKTLKTDLSVSRKLVPLVPKSISSVIESGIESKEEIRRFQKLGANAFLIGTSLMKAANITAKLRELKKGN